MKKSEDIANFPQINQPQSLNKNHWNKYQYVGKNTNYEKYVHFEY